MSDGDDGEPGTDAEQRGDGLAPAARDLEAELAERRRERFGAAAADVADEPESANSDELITPPEPDTAEVDSETARAFWAAVIYVNAGLFVFALGLLLAGFRGRLQVGAMLVGAAAVALYRAWSVYRAFRTRDDTAQAADEE